MGAAGSQSCCKLDASRVASELHTSSLSLLFLGEDDQSRRSSQSSRPGPGKPRGVPVLRVPPSDSSNLSLMATLLERPAVSEFNHMLRSHGIPTETWGKHGAKAVDQLFWELFCQRGSILTGLGTKQLKRVTRLLKIRLLADIDGADHVVVSRLQLMHDGQQIQRQQLPLRRLRWKLPSDNALLQSCESTLYDEEHKYVESWRSCWMSVLNDRFGIPALQGQLQEVGSGYTFHTEDNVQSAGYPGLNTMYCVHEVTLRVISPDQKLACIGLPLGQEFATADTHFDLDRFQSREEIPIGSQMNVWSWTPVKDFDKAAGLQGVTGGPAGDGPKKPDTALQRLERELALLKRVPIHTSISKAASINEAAAPKNQNMKRGAPNAHLRRILAGKRTDWRTVRKMANRLLDRDYTLAQFNTDLAAFPELSLYLRDGVVGTGSGRTTDDEYQRTVCAFFAIYWLTRLDLEGRQGFSFGTDEDWKVLEAASVQDGQVAMQSSSAPPEMQQRLYNKERRLAFLNNAQWGFFRRLMVDAGLIDQVGNGRDSFKVNETRMVSLLALTAFHDIMKMEKLLPTVQSPHDGYHGYEAGDVIGDHDHALCYIMDHYPDLLPSFRELGSSERQSIQFTQCNLCFNHGWLVQAEAPPGAIFTKFREAITADRRLHAGAPDVALYFVHWLTDLAGAEPSPLGGCEKFVIKFPLHVLNSFLQSFKFIEGIASQTETQVMEKYLKYRWSDHVPSLGEPPRGPHGLAAMRLLCMAQAHGRTVVEAFNQELPDEDKEVLSVEMARTGCAGQSFSPELVPMQVLSRPAGPAFLIYYGPAFLQAVGSDSVVLRLRILTEIYRCARELWPESQAAVATSVHVRIDAIKGLGVDDISEALVKGELWLVTKHNESEAFVEKASHRKLNKFVRNGQKFQILDLGFLRESH